MPAAFEWPRLTSGLFVLMVTFFVLARTLEARWGVGEDWSTWSTGTGPIWWGAWSAALVTFCLLRLFKKRTRLLHVDGR